jgi:cold-inducible RNA-binding protein
MSKKLYVGNLSYEVTEDELSQVFSQCGQVTSATVIRDKHSGRSKGFGFVEMPNDDEATHAVDRMKGTELKGRPLVVDIAREPERRPRGDGDFGGGGYSGPRGRRGSPRGNQSGSRGRDRSFGNRRDDNDGNY